MKKKYKILIILVSIVILALLLIIAGYLWVYKYGHVNPYVRFQACNINTCAAPVGIVSYGIYNYSNTKSYVIKTPELLGLAHINSIKSNNLKDSSIPANSASLQLNGVLVVQNKNGSINKYFLQLITTFVTDSNDIRFDSSIYGLTKPLTEGSLNGGINCQFTFGISYYACSFEQPNGNLSFSVATPLLLQMKLYEYVDNGSVRISPEINFSGSNSKSYVLSSGNFSLIDKGAESSYFLIDGKTYTLNGHSQYYDAEFVFGGYGNTQITKFTSMNSTLKLLYYNVSSNVFQNFPSYYNFGLDTGETTNTLSTSLLVNNSIIVTTGKPDYGYVGNST